MLDKRVGAVESGLASVEKGVLLLAVLLGLRLKLGLLDMKGARWGQRLN